MSRHCEAATIGQTIRALRELRKLSLVQLAEASGVSKGFLSQMENGKNSNPSLQTLQKIADALQFKLNIRFEL